MILAHLAHVASMQLQSLCARYCLALQQFETRVLINRPSRCYSAMYPASILLVFCVFHSVLPGWWVACCWCAFCSCRFTTQLCLNLFTCSNHTDENFHHTDEKLINESTVSRPQTLRSNDDCHADSPGRTATHCKRPKRKKYLMYIVCMWYPTIGRAAFC
jgi:hypothetical protein